MTGGDREEAAPTGGWRTATVREVRHPIAGTILLRLDIADRIDHLPGQHYVIRLRAEDGYTAQRSYSIASAPADELLELFVEQLPDGEVSSFLAEVVLPGDEIEVRGPIGGWFVWRGDGPVLGIGGGTGVVPLVSMLRFARQAGLRDRLTLVAAARTMADLPYAQELIAAGARIALSRQDYAGRGAGHLVAADLADLVAPADVDGRGRIAFVCGSAGFAETTSRLLVDLGVTESSVRVERFGPTG